MQQAPPPSAPNNGSPDHRQFVKTHGIGSEDARRKREELTVRIRKQAREESFRKRRQATEPNPVSQLEVAQQLAECHDGIYSNDLQRTLRAVEGFRKLLSVEKNPPILEVIKSNVVPRLIEFLVSPDEALQYESLWALTNIASGTHQHTRYLVDQGVIPIFTKLLQSSHHKIREQACWALGNIAGDCSEMRDRVLQHDVMKETLNLLTDKTSKLTLIRIATWTMSNLCRGKPQPEFKLVKDSIPIAARLIYSSDKEVLVDALWTLSFLSDGKDKKQKAVAEASVCPRLVNLLQSNELQFLVPALRTIGNLMSGDDRTTQKVIESHALEALVPLLNHPKAGVKKEACWTVSNVLAGTTQQIQNAIDAGLIEHILQRLYNDRFDIKKEAAWCIANAVSGANSSQILFFVQNGVIPPLCSLLELPDPQLLDMTLDAIERTLKVGNKLKVVQKMADNPFAYKIEECGGVDKIEMLQTHDNTVIYDKSVRILEKYFHATSDEDTTLAPQVDPAQQQFMFGGAQAPQGGGGFQFNGTYDQ